MAYSNSMDRSRRHPVWPGMALLAGAVASGCSASAPEGLPGPATMEGAPTMLVETQFSGRERELALAAGNGDVAAVARLVREQGVNPDALSVQGMPLLLWPLARRNLAGFTALLEAGANPNLRSAEGEIIMHYVVEAGGADFVRAALDHGARVNQSNRDREPLVHIARRVGDWPSVKLLVERGADIDAPAMGLADNTLLSISTGFGDFENAYWLLEHGADPTVRLREAIAPEAVGTQPIIEDIFHRPADPTNPRAAEWQRRCQALLAARGITAPPAPRRYALAQQ